MNEKIVIQEVSETIAIAEETTLVDVSAVTIELVEVGAQGPAGPPGADSAIAIDGYTHTQASPSDTWTINHNLGRRPIVTLLTTGAVEFDAQLTHLSNNQAVVNLATAIAGTARCL